MQENSIFAWSTFRGSLRSEEEIALLDGELAEGFGKLMLRTSLDPLVMEAVLTL
jgi:hypothetical protein